MSGSPSPDAVCFSHVAEPFPVRVCHSIFAISMLIKATWIPPVIRVFDKFERLQSSLNRNSRTILIGAPKGFCGEERLQRYNLNEQPSSDKWLSQSKTGNNQNEPRERELQNSSSKQNDAWTARWQIPKDSSLRTKANAARTFLS